MKVEFARKMKLLSCAWAAVSLLSGCNSQSVESDFQQGDTPSAGERILQSLPMPAPEPSATRIPSTVPFPAPTLTSVPSPTATPVDPLTGSANLDSEERVFLDLINAHRTAQRLAPLQVSAKLTRAADWLSTDMAAYDYFSHTDRLGRSFSSRIDDFGYDESYSIGENIAAGNATAQATFNQWKNSSGHNANMLSRNYRVIGIARAQGRDSSYGWYWTTDFGGAPDSTEIPK